MSYEVQQKVPESTSVVFSLNAVGDYSHMV